MGTENFIPYVAMAKSKKKLTAAQRAAKQQRKKDFVTVFMNGKQVRVRRPPTIDGMDQEEFIRQNADPIWLKQHGHYEILHEHEMEENEEVVPTSRSQTHIEQDDLPF